MPPASPDPAPSVRYGAVVLTGGTGTRLGGVEKAEVVVGGRTLLDRALTATAEADVVVVVGPRAQTERRVQFVREDPPRSGPAAGLLAGLDALERWSAEQAGTGPDRPVLLLAVDMPLVSPATVRRLLAAAAEREGAVLVDADGRRQLCLTLSPERLPDLRRSDGAVGLGLFRLLGPLDLVEVQAVGNEAYDVDTPADLQALDSRSPEAH